MAIEERRWTAWPPPGRTRSRGSVRTGTGSAPRPSPTRCSRRSPTRSSPTATELAHALFQGHAYTPYGYTQNALPPAKDGHGVHGPWEKPGEGGPGIHGPEPTPEAKAKEALRIEDAKAALMVERAVDREVATMTPEERQFAERFRGAAIPNVSDPAKGAMNMASGMEDLANFAKQGLEELQSRRPGRGGSRAAERTGADPAAVDARDAAAGDVSAARVIYPVPPGGGACGRPARIRSTHRTGTA